MTIGIYRITNLVDGSVYIGSSSNVEQREIDHFKKSVFKSDRKHLPLYVAIKKHGLDNFILEVIEECELEELFEREDYYLEKYRDMPNYNTVYKATPMHDEQFAEKQSKALSERNKRKWKDPGYRKHMSEILSELAIERTKDPEKIKNAVEGLNKYTNSIKRPVGQYDKKGNLIATFEGVREAERAMGLPNDMIGKVCRGVKYRKTAGGYVWKYLDKESVETNENKTAP